MSDRRKIARSFFYALGSGYAARACSLVFTFLLRDVLGPEVFRITLTGLIVFVLVAGLRDFGWLHSLLHFQDRAGEFVQTHFALNALVSLLVCGLAALLAGGLYLYHPARFAWPAVVICTYSALYFLRCTTQTSEALMRRDFEFGRLGLYHGLATVTALSAALLTAWLGWGRWSLLIGGWTTYSVYSGVYSLGYSAALWWSRPIALWPLRIDWQWARRLLEYGKWFWLAWGVLLNFIWNYDKLVLVVLDEAALPLYEYAWWLMQLPTAIVAHIVFSYTNTLYSRYQRDRRQLSLLYSRMMALIARAAALVALLIVVNARDITALLRSEWSAAAAMVVWLAAYAFLRPLFDDGIGLLWAVGDTRRTALIMATQALLALVLVPALWFGAGVQGVCYAMALVAAAGVCGVVRGVRCYADVAWRRVLGAPALAVALALAASWALDAWMAELPLAVRLLARGTWVGSAFAGVLWGVERHLLREDWQQVRRALSR